MEGRTLGSRAGQVHLDVRVAAPQAQVRSRVQEGDLHVQAGVHRDQGAVHHVPEAADRVQGAVHRGLADRRVREVARRGLVEVLHVLAAHHGRAPLLHVLVVDPREVVPPFLEVGPACQAVLPCRVGVDHPFLKQRQPMFKELALKNEIVVATCEVDCHLVVHGSEVLVRVVGLSWVALHPLVQGVVQTDPIKKNKPFRQCIKFVKLEQICLH